MRDKFTVGYSWFADIYCYEHGQSLPDTDPEGNEKHPIATWHIAELLEHSCAECGLAVEQWR